jgi:AraC family transcriptional regulator
MTSEYSDRIDRVLLHIDRNLDRRLSLEEIAGIGAFSPFHFHRVFKAQVGETLHAYILRRRLSLAASLLLHRTEWDLTRVSAECGFSSPSDFSRAFKKAFGKSPRGFRAAGVEKAIVPPREAPASGPAARRAREILGRAEHRRLEDERLAFVTCIGVSMRMDTPRILEAFTRLHSWSALLGLAAGEARFLGLVYDDPSITPEERLRYLAALALPRDLVVGGKVPRGIGLEGFSLAGSYLAFGLDRGSPTYAEDYLACMDLLFKEWMPARSLAPDQRPIVEAYSAGSGGRTLVEVHVPCRVA